MRVFREFRIDRRRIQDGDEPPARIEDGRAGATESNVSGSKVLIKVHADGARSAMQVPIPFVPSTPSDQMPPVHVPQYLNCSAVVSLPRCCKAMPSALHNRTT